MEAAIYSDAAMLGMVTFEHLDSGMGVALGPFVPSGRYSAYLHANTINGDYTSDKGLNFSVRVDGKLVETRGVSIEDYTLTLQEIHAAVFFKHSREYEALFRDHPEL